MTTEAMPRGAHAPVEIDPTETWDVLHHASAPDLHWSTDTIGEGLPGLLTPLGFPLWHHPVDDAGRESAYRVGVLSRKERGARPEDRRMVLASYGRAAMQTEFYGLIGDRLPGTSGGRRLESILGRVPDDLTFGPTRRRYPVVGWIAELEHADPTTSHGVFVEAAEKFAQSPTMQAC